MRQSNYLTLSAICFLTACGGRTTNDVVSFSELQSRINAFQGAAGGPIIEELDLTPDADLPTSGSYSYTGAVAVAVESNGENDLDDIVAVGSARLVAEFSDQQITGTADNFYQLNDPNVDDINEASGVAIAGNLKFEFEQETLGQNS